VRLDSARILELFTHTPIFTEKIIAFSIREIDESRSVLKPKSIGYSGQTRTRDGSNARVVARPRRKSFLPLVRVHSGQGTSLFTR